MWPQVAGTSHDMFAVDKERAAATSNCYISTLHILSIDQHHARDYVLRLENEHGEEVRTNDANISDVELWDRVPQKVPSEANPKVRNHGEGPY